jgi:hypothetical protein
VQVQEFVEDDGTGTYSAFREVLTRRAWRAVRQRSLRSHSVHGQLCNQKFVLFRLEQWSWGDFNSADPVLKLRKAENETGKKCLRTALSSDFEKC